MKIVKIFSMILSLLLGSVAQVHASCEAAAASSDTSMLSEGDQAFYEECCARPARCPRLLDEAINGILAQVSRPIPEDSITGDDWDGKRTKAVRKLDNPFEVSVALIEYYTSQERIDFFPYHLKILAEVIVMCALPMTALAYAQRYCDLTWDKVPIFCSSFPSAWPELSESSADADEARALGFTFIRNYAQRVISSLAAMDEMQTDHSMMQVYAWSQGFISAVGAIIDDYAAALSVDIVMSIIEQLDYVNQIILSYDLYEKNDPRELLRLFRLSMQQEHGRLRFYFRIAPRASSELLVSLLRAECFEDIILICRDGKAKMNKLIGSKELSEEQKEQIVQFEEKVAKITMSSSVALLKVAEDIETGDLSSTSCDERYDVMDDRISLLYDFPRLFRETVTKDERFHRPYRWGDDEEA